MRTLRLSEDVVTVSEFKAQAAEWLKKVAKTRQPLVITQNGKPAGVVLSPAAFDDLAERTRLLAAIDEGLADAKAGRVIDHATLKAEMKERFGRPRRR